MKPFKHEVIIHFTNGINEHSFITLRNINSASVKLSSMKKIPV